MDNLSGWVGGKENHVRWANQCTAVQRRARGGEGATYCPGVGMRPPGPRGPLLPRKCSRRGSGFRALRARPVKTDQGVVPPRHRGRVLQESVLSEIQDPSSYGT